MRVILYCAAGALAILVFGVGWVFGYKSKKHPMCDTCDHLERKGGGAWAYYCCAKGYTSSFDKPPEYCKMYKPKEET